MGGEMNAVPRRVLRQWVVDYNFTSRYDETVMAAVWMMSDGTEQTLYDGKRIDNQSGMTKFHDYGERCPNVERAQQEAA